MSEHQGSSGQIDWPQVLREHDRWLRNVLYARLRCVEAVEDVLQEIGLAVTRQRSPLRDAGKVGPWLYQTAIRQAMLYRRRLGRQRSLTRQKRRQSSHSRRVLCLSRPWDPSLRRVTLLS